MIRRPDPYEDGFHLRHRNPERRRQPRLELRQIRLGLDVAEEHLRNRLHIRVYFRVHRKG